MAARLRERYREHVIQALTKEFSYKNTMAVPRLEKIVLNMGVGREAQTNQKVFDKAAMELATISGQKPVITKAKKSIAAFKLTLEVWTNGSVKPENAIGLASKLIKDHMQIFISFEEEPELAEADSEEAARITFNENLDRSVDELELSVRSYNCLKNADIRTIRELVQKSEPDMLRTKNFGRKSLNEIKEILQSMGLY